MPHEYPGGEVVDGTQEGPIIHGVSSGVSGTVRQISVDENGKLELSGALVAEPYDDMYLIYTGARLDAVEYIHSATTFATVTLSYTGDNLTRVTRT